MRRHDACSPSFTVKGVKLDLTWDPSLPLPPESVSHVDALHESRSVTKTWLCPWNSLIEKRKTLGETRAAAYLQFPDWPSAWPG